MKLLDEYEIKAQRCPALLALFPLLFGAYALFPDLRGSWGYLGGVAVALGLPTGLAFVARHLGKQLEDPLYERWGGKPTTVMLRWSDSQIVPETKARYHAAMRKAGLAMPTREEEAENPTKADETYEAAGDLLRGKTRAKKAFPFVFTHLVSYGFARNLLGLRWIGLGISMVCAVIEIIIIFKTIKAGSEISGFLVGPAVISVGAAIFWICFVRSNWVRNTAHSYARALFEACEYLTGKKKDK